MKSIYLIILINLVFLYSFYELTEKDKERLPNPKDRQRFEKFLKKLQKIDDYINIEPRVLEGDTSESESGESESESGESESESGESESGESAGNKTEEEPAPITAPAVPPKPNRGARVTLVSFNKFVAATTKNPSRKKGADPNKQVYYIDFLIRLFFSADVPTPPRKVVMALIVSGNSRLRSLEDKENVDAECLIDDSDLQKQGNSTIKYNCEAESEIKPEEVGAKDELTFYQEKDGTTPIENLSENIEITPQAYVEATNLEKNALPSANFATLYGKVEGKVTYFLISGILKSDDPNDDTPLKPLIGSNPSIKFVFYDNRTNPTLQDGKRVLDDLNSKELIIDCPVTNNDPNNYKITCRPPEAFQGNLHRASGTIDDTSLMLDLEEGKDGVSVDPNPETQKNPTYYRKDSSGLSGGSIAGIVIACAAVLIIATIVALVLKSPKAPVNNNSSIVGLKTDDFQG